ncbi:MAG: DUF3656 domain-containing U32 family peptidase [Pirellulaceae bacterium]
MTEQRSQPELMSPAGHWPQLRAAIEAGADAVYFGLDHFSARAKVGFCVEELPEVMTTLHERAVKGFVTFNTLVFDDELRRAEQAIIDIANAGADAIIVQDTGVAQLARQIVPDLEIHGSTQMSVTSAQGAELARQFGCSRVVLGRELSLDDIARIRTATDVELEVFVHGALCVSYSGQCFSSEAWGGRSANRGQCAQACRLSYDLIVDGVHRELGPDRYLLSPGDLYAIKQIPELVRLGIACLKIEGRYKDENYVAVTTAAYRKAINAAAANADNRDVKGEKQQLEQVYSRGLGPHFIAGTNHQSVVQARAPRHRGRSMGHVVRVDRGSVIVELDDELHAGDGIVFDAADWRSPDEPEEGGNVYQVEPHADGTTRLGFGEGDIDFSRIRAGDRVWRTNDPRLLVQLKPLAQAKSVTFTRPLKVKVIARQGLPLELHASDGGRVVTITGQQDLVAAEQHALSERKLSEHLGRLGGTPFHLASLELDCPNESLLFLPVSQLNQLRRQMVEALLLERKQLQITRTTRGGVVDQWFVDQAEQDKLPGPVDGRLHLLVRTPEQLAAAIESRPASITLDYLELYGLRPSVEKIQAAGLVARVASPRILKPAEQRVIRFLLSLDCSILVRSGGLLFDLLQQPADQLPPLIGDFSLNIANVVSANDWLQRGLAAITPTYDLNAKQIKQLARWVNPSQIEVIAWSHLPVFHTEHCVFCRFMSSGTDHTNCGHPCEKHRVSLRDHNGREHPVMADVGCRNTVFGAEAQTSPESLAAWRNAGIVNFRLEFVHENPAQVKRVAELFGQTLSGEINYQQLAAALPSVSPAGITAGSFFVPRGRLAIEKRELK